ncbi:MAG: hypothetical protein HC817_10630 [Saprospiraceae bacterium]|nr:hypothetical protein [Saprospiraceae bacterium]
MKTINLTALNASKNTLRTAGIRIFGSGTPLDTVTVAQDLEPEYVVFSPDSRFLYVTMQENNAILTIDVRQKDIALNGTLPAIFPLGLKDLTTVGNGFDASDRSPAASLANWRVKAAYSPDAIAFFNAAQRNYLVTANEGDYREYGNILEETTVSSLRLDRAKFPDSTFILREEALGRLAVSKFTGDTDGDGDNDEIHVNGARSFTIWDASNGNLVWDSGDWLERITRDSIYFNANNSNTNIARKNRSDNKGPEPEGVATAVLNGRTYAFVSLERVGGVAAFNVTNPQNPTFATYTNNRRGVATDDLGPEGILFINAADSPDNKKPITIGK